MEMSGGAPERVRTSIGDRDFLVDVFVELFEDTPAASSVLEVAGSNPRDNAAKDFRADVEHWLAHTLVAPPAVRLPRRQTRRRDAEPTL